MRLSIRRKIILFIAGPVFLIYALILGYGVMQLHQQAKMQVETEMAQLASHHAAEFDAYLREVSQIARTTADFLELHPEITEAQIYEQLRRNVQGNPLVYGGAIAFEPYQFQGQALFSPYVYRDGTELMEMDIGATGYDYTKPRWQWWNHPRNTNSAVWTEPYLDEGAGNIPMSTYSVPFYKDGRFWGVTTVDIPLELLREKVKIVDIEGREFFIVTASGYYLSHHIRELIGRSMLQSAQGLPRDDVLELGNRMISGETGIKRIPRLDIDEIQWIFYAPIESTGWSYAVSINESDVLAFVRRQAMLAAGALAISLILITLGVWLVAVWIARPIVRLNAAAQALSDGDMNVRVDINANDEVGNLARTFSTMAKTLAAREQSLREQADVLEHRVDERTAELRESEERFRSLLNATPDSIVIVNEAGEIVFVNSQAETMFGYDRDALLGKSVEMLVPERYRKAHSVDRHRYLGDPTIRPMGVSRELEAMHRDGSTFPVEISLSPISLGSDQGTLVTSAIRDITERKRTELALKRSEEHLKRILDTANEGFWFIDNDAIGRDVNPMLCRLLGRERDEIIGRSILEFADETNKRTFETQMEQRAKGDSGSYEVALSRPDGSQVTCLFHASPYFDESGEKTGSFAMIADITEQKRAEQALRESEERFQLAMDAASDGLWDWQVQTGEVHHSPRYLGMLGYGPDELPHSLETFETLVHPEDLARVKAITDEHLRHGPDSYEFELRMRAKSGDYRWILSRGRVAVRDADGRPERAVGTHVDITERKRAEQKFRAIFDYSTDAYLIQDQNVFTDCNASAVALFGVTEESEIIGQNAVTFSPKLQPDGVSSETKAKTVVEAAFRQGTQRFDWVIQRPNGEEVPVEVTLIRVTIDERASLLAVVHDLTERRRAEKAMVKARRMAEEASRAKGEFLANMSHEIRTPMNAILGMAHLCMQTDLQPRQRNYLEKIDSASHALLGIINDILDFSKIEAGKLELEFIDFRLEDVLENVSNVVGLKAQEKDLELLFSIEPKVPNALIGDPLRLGQVLINLAGNAVKFTHAGEVVIGARKLNEKDGVVTLQFHVRDTGIGLTEEQQGRLFESFTQADGSTTRHFGGTGLGLAISKRFVEMMGGEIHVDSAPGAGSTFSFTGAFQRQERESQKEMRPAEDLEGMRVLVADDNETSRKVLKEMLESFSFDVSLATSGEEAISAVENAAAEERPYDLVLMDWKMPGMNGIDAAGAIKQHEDLAAIPTVVMVTAYGREEVMHQASGAELDGFLLKPVSPSVMFDTVMQVFGKQAARHRRPSTRPSRSPAAPAKLAGARILLVEDNEINREVAVEILEGADSLVDVAPNGKEALAALERTRFDGVVMDVQMPEMDGYEATRRIRQDPRFQDLPIIAMTANALAGDRERCLEAGMNDYVSKPIDPDELFATLGQWIKPTVKAADAPVGDAKVSATPPAERDIQAPEFLDQLPGFDTEAGLQRVRGNRELYARLLLKFASAHAGDANAIREALNAENFSRAASFAHTLKGLAGNLGASEVYAAARDFEASVKNKEAKHTERRSKFDRLDDALKRALETVQSALQQLSTQPALQEDQSPLPPNLLREVAHRLRAAAEIGDISEVRTVASDLPAQSHWAVNVVRLAEEFDLDALIQLAQEMEEASGVSTS